MLHYTYRSCESQTKDEHGNPRATYGIALYIDRSEEPQRVIYDIFNNKLQAEALAKLCTELQLSPEHIDDVIEDLLAWA